LRKEEGRKKKGGRREIKLLSYLLLSSSVT
jgi:hypothetical protein